MSGSPLPLPLVAGSGDHLPQPRLVRRLPHRGAPGAVRAARAPGVRARTLPRARARAAAGRGPRRAGRLPRRGRGRPGLRAQRHHGREHGAALAALRARATSCSPPTTSTTPRATRWTGSPAAWGVKVGGGAAALALPHPRRPWWRPCWRTSPRAPGCCSSTTSPARRRSSSRSQELVRRAARARRGDAGGRRARPRPGAAVPARAGRGLLHRQLPQVAVRSQGRRLPPRAQGSSGGPQAAGR